MGSYIMMNDYDVLFKIVVIGDGGVGKTALLERYIHKTFDAQTKATIGVDFYTQLMSIEEHNIKLQFWDTAGQERFRAISPMYYKGVNGLIVCYDMTNPKSFENIDKWLEEAKRHIGYDVPKIIIGTKSDLQEISINKNKYTKLNVMMYETSAKYNDDDNIEKAINDLVNYIYDNSYGAQYKLDLTGEIDKNMIYDKIKTDCMSINLSQNIKTNKKKCILCK